MTEFEFASQAQSSKMGYVTMFYILMCDLSFQIFESNRRWQQTQTEISKLRQPSETAGDEYV